MTIYVDPLKNWPNGEWCHMITDGPIEELHEFAKHIELKRAWFQNKNKRFPHYDLRAGKRDRAIRRGAQKVSSKRLITILKAGK